MRASEARKLAGIGDELSAQEAVDRVLIQIKEAAKAGKRKLCLHEEPWVHGVYRNDPDVKLAYKILEGLGYEVKFHYEELQFVNMFTVVEW
jgi:hypothetical protein